MTFFQLSIKDEIDLLILPELVFTGYDFDNKEDIKPFLEVAGKGPTFEWCQLKANE